jgi:hypothetical protein
LGCHVVGIFAELAFGYMPPYPVSASGTRELG